MHLEPGSFPMDRAGHPRQDLLVIPNHPFHRRCCRVLIDPSLELIRHVDHWPPLPWSVVSPPRSNSRTSYSGRFRSSPGLLGDNLRGINHFGRITTPLNLVIPATPR